MDNLTEQNNYQVSLFENIDETKKNETLDITIDSINEKYGKQIINKANLKEINVKKKY